MIINSVQNKRIKELVKLHNKKYRDKTKLFLVEGVHLVEEAIEAGVVKTVFLEENVNLEIGDIEKIIVSKEVFNKISETQTTQGALALCFQKEMPCNDDNFVLLIDGVQDPGNLGTIIRSSDAFNVDLIVLGHGCADLYNQKVIRSTQGSMFHVPIIKRDIKSYLESFNGYVYGTSLRNSTSIENVNFNHDKLAFIVGNEGNGVSEELLKMTNENIIIDMPGQSESLNVGVATSIILYEISKNRK